jgi:hypothetical protein
MKRCLALVLFAGCSSLTHSPDAGLDSGVFNERKYLNWREVKLPWKEPTAFQIVSIDERVAIFATAYATDDKTDNTTISYVSDWAEDAGVFNVRGLETFSSALSPRYTWNGAMLLNHGSSGDQSVGSIYVPGAKSATQMYDDYFFSDSRWVEVGAVTRRGEAWMLKDGDYHLRMGFTGMCPGNTMQLHQRQSDGGARGPLCPFEPDFIPEGKESVQQFLHPTRRIFFRSNMGFITFDENAKILGISRGYNERYIPSDDDDYRVRKYSWPQFWPTNDDPPRMVGPKTLYRSADYPLRGDEFLTEDVYEWRWEDAGVKKVSSILSEYTDEIDSLRATSRGVLVSAYVKEQSWDGGSWKADFIRHYRQRFILASNDGTQVINFQDIAATVAPAVGCDADFVAEDHGKFYAFCSRNVYPLMGPTVHKLYYAPLDL